MKKLLAFSFSIFMTALVCCGQEKKDPLVSGTFTNLTWEQFFKQLESKAPCYFYYDINQLDSTLVNIEVKDEPLSAVLDKALKNSGLLFSIDDNNRVYITKNIRVITHLPQGFFPA
ncbi:MAG TPA: STN domain-containing protein, partial [Chitinophagaceae bacterium]|nr:STN domain-containing protein [Chitinophagaceae bacterium]